MKTIRRLTAGLVGLLMVSQIVIPTAAAAKETLQLQTVQNGVVEYKVNPQNGRFTIKTVDGLPGKVSDNDKNLTYAGKEPDSSFTTIRIDGKDYIYGSRAGLFGQEGGMQGIPVTEGTLNTSAWSVGDIEVIQKLQLISDPANPNVGNVRMTYEVRNNSAKSHEVGSRILLDTMLGLNDASPMVLGSQYITNETLFEGDGVPGSWKSADERYAPAIVAYGLLSGWENNAPDKLLAAHWESVSTTTWDYTPKELLNFTTDKNQYESADSAIGLFWEPRTLKGGESFVFETYYGIGSISDSYSESNFNLQMSTPSKLTVNTNGTAYNETSFEVQVNLDNQMDNAVDMNNVKIDLGFESGLSMADGQNASRLVERIKKGERLTLSWNLKADPQKSLTVVPIGVTVTYGDTVVESSKYIVLPSVNGTPPKMQMTGVSPEKLYYKANQKKLIVKGSDYNSLKADRDWELFLRHKDTGKTVAISQKDVYIENEALTIVIDPKLEFDHGIHDVVLKTAKYGTMSQSINLTNDKKYDRKEFGTLTIRNTAPSGDDPVYEIEMWDSEAALEAVDKDIRDSMLVTMRGNIINYELDGVQIYEAGPGAIMNRAVKYQPPADKAQSPIKLVKEQFYDEDSGEYGHRIHLEGYGSLAIADYNFHYGSFYIDLVDGIEYELPDPKMTDDRYEGNSYGDADVADVTIVTPVNQVITNVANGIGKLLGFQVEVKNAVLGDGTVSLGGSVKLEVPMWAASDDDEEEEDDDSKLTANEKALKDRFDKNDKVQGGFGAAKDAVSGKGDDDKFLVVNLDEMRYGVAADNTSYLEGFIADGKVKLDSSLIPGMDFGVEASLGLDSLNYPGVYADISAAVEVGDAFACEAQVILVFETNGQTLPDAVKFVVSGEVIKIPLGPLGFLTKMGGGVFGLYDTLKGGYKYVPPVMIKAFTGYADPTMYSFELEDITIAVGGQGVEVKGENGKIVGLDVIEEVYGHILAYDTDQGPAVDMGVGFSANLLDIVKGEASVWLIYDPTLDGLFGPVSMGGKAFVGVFIPSWIPLVGGKEIYSVGAEVSTYRLFLGVSIIGIPVSVGYYWEDGQVIFGDSYEGKRSRSALDAADTIPQSVRNNALYIESVNNNEGTSSMVFGSNMRTTYNAPLPKDGQAKGRSAGLTKHVIPVKDQAYSLFQVGYEGEAPEVNVTKPDGSTYELIEGQNFMEQTIPASQSNSGKDEHYLFISAENPMNGNWTITANKTIGAIAKDVLAIPEVKHVAAQPTANSEVQVTWQGNEMAAGDTVKVYLSEDLGTVPAPAGVTSMSVEESADLNKELAQSYDAGLLLADGIPATDGTAKVTIPDRMQSGNYKIRVALNRDGDAVSSAMSEESFQYVNPNTPAAPTGVQVDIAGDGMFQVKYDQQSDIDGYILEILDAEGNSIKSISPVTANPTTTKTLVGGTYHATVLDENGDPQPEEALSGAIPGETYRVSVKSYRKVNDVVHSSESIVSEPMLLPVPNPAELNISVNDVKAMRDNAAGMKRASMVAEDPTLKATVNVSDPALTITANQDSEALVMVNGALVATEQAYLLAAGVPTELKLTSLPEGENKIEIVSKNAGNDYTTAALMVTVDTTPPELMVNNVVPTSENGVYTLTGTVETNAAIYFGDNNTPVEQKDGTFQFTGTTAELVETVVVTAVDRAGNSTRMEVDVIASELAALQRMELRNEDGSALEGDVVKINRDELLDLAAYGIAANGKEFRLPDRMLKWQVVAGDGRSTIDEAGRITTNQYGEAVIAASFKLTESYSLEQTVTLDIADVYRQPNQIRISTETIANTLPVDSAAALVSVPQATAGVSYSYSLTGTDADYFAVHNNQILLKKPVDKESFSFTVVAQGTHIVNDKTEQIGKAFSTDFTLRTIRKMVAVAEPNPLYQEVGSSFENLKLPAAVHVTLSDQSVISVPVTWKSGAYQPNVAGNYQIQGTLGRVDQVENSDGLEAKMLIQTYVPQNVPGGSSGGSTYVEVPEQGKVITIPIHAKPVDKVIAAEVSASDLESKLNKAGEQCETVIVDIRALDNLANDTNTIKLSLSPKVIELLTRTDKTTLRMKTQLAEVNLSPETLKALLGRSAVELVVARQSDGSTDIVLNDSGTAIKQITGGLEVHLSSPNMTVSTVAAKVNTDGKTTVLKKSAHKDGVMFIPLEGSARVRLIDNGKSFADVRNQHWYWDPVNFVSSRELLSGTTTKRFNPSGEISRAMFVTALHRLENMPSSDHKSFPDVNSGAYYADAVAWGSAQGIVAGIGNSFKPNDAISREQLATMMYRYAASIGVDVSAVGSLARYADREEVSMWANQGMSYALGAGLITGKSDSILDPQGKATRAEVAAILERFIRSLSNN